MATTKFAETDEKSLRRVIFSCFIGTLIEWYDFVIFGTIAVLVFDELFFPSASPLVALVASLGTFAVGFIARPIGGLFFGYLGDRRGRRIVLVLTMGLMGVSTLLIGLLPTYASIGAAAPVLLTILRLIQGFSLGGEWGGAATLLVEHAPNNGRGRAGSIGQLGGVAGPLLATLLIAGMTTFLSHEELLAWGWRIPFLVSVLLVVVSVYVRRHVSESQSFTRLKEQDGLSKTPMRDAFRNHPKQIFAVFAMGSGNTILFYTCITLSVVFLTGQGGLGESGALLVNIVFLASATVSALIFGRILDRVGRKPVFMAGAISAMIMAFPLFWLYGSGNMAAIIPTAIVMGVIEGGLLYGGQSAYFSELFPTRHRLGGMNIGYQAATVAIGSTAPIIGVLLMEWADGSAWMFSIYLICIQILCLGGVLIAGETLGSDIDNIGKSSEQRALDDAVIDFGAR